MTNVFVDTTILTDALLKTGQDGRLARAALSRCNYSQMPQYAIKEFKAGPLSYYVWMANKLTTTKSFVESLRAVQRLSRGLQRNRTSTAIQALVEADTILLQQPAPLEAAYGPIANRDRVKADQVRLAIKKIIFDAWKNRRGAVNKVVNEYSCYTEVEIEENRGLIEIKGAACLCAPNCLMETDLRVKRNSLLALKRLLKSQDTTPARSKALKSIKKLLGSQANHLNDVDCRALGDMVFSLLCPEDSVILTTNLRDHETIAQLVGRRAVGPDKI